MKKILTILLSVFLVFALTSCNDELEQKLAQAEAERDQAYAVAFHDMVYDSEHDLDKDYKVSVTLGNDGKLKLTGTEKAEYILVRPLLSTPVEDAGLRGVAEDSQQFYYLDPEKCIFKYEEGGFTFYSPSAVCYNFADNSYKLGEAASNITFKGVKAIEVVGAAFNNNTNVTRSITLDLTEVETVYEALLAYVNSTDADLKLDDIYESTTKGVASGWNYTVKEAPSIEGAKVKYNYLYDEENHIEETLTANQNGTAQVLVEYVKSYDADGSATITVYSDKIWNQVAASEITDSVTVRSQLSNYKGINADVAPAADADADAVISLNTDIFNACSGVYYDFTLPEIEGDKITAYYATNLNTQALRGGSLQESSNPFAEYTGSIEGTFDNSTTYSVYYAEEGKLNSKIVEKTVDNTTQFVYTDLITKKDATVPNYPVYTTAKVYDGEDLYVNLSVASANTGFARKSSWYALNLNKDELKDLIDFNHSFVQYGKKTVCLAECFDNYDGMIPFEGENATLILRLNKVLDSSKTPENFTFKFDVDELSESTVLSVKKDSVVDSEYTVTIIPELLKLTDIQAFDGSSDVIYIYEANKEAIEENNVGNQLSMTFDFTEDKDVRQFYGKDVLVSAQLIDAKDLRTVYALTGDYYTGFGSNMDSDNLYTLTFKLFDITSRPPQQEGDTLSVPATNEVTDEKKAKDVLVKVIVTDKDETNRITFLSDDTFRYARFNDDVKTVATLTVDSKKITNNFWVDSTKNRVFEGTKFTLALKGVNLYERKTGYVEVIFKDSNGVVLSYNTYKGPKEIVLENTDDYHLFEFEVGNIYDTQDDASITINIYEDVKKTKLLYTYTADDLTFIENYDRDLPVATFKGGLFFRDNDYYNGSSILIDVEEDQTKQFDTLNLSYVCYTESDDGVVKYYDNFVFTPAEGQKGITVTEDGFVVETDAVYELVLSGCEDPLEDVHVVFTVSSDKECTPYEIDFEFDVDLPDLPEIKASFKGEVNLIYNGSKLSVLVGKSNYFKTVDLNFDSVISFTDSTNKVYDLVITPVDNQIGKIVPANEDNCFAVETGYIYEFEVSGVKSDIFADDANFLTVSVYTDSDLPHVPSINCFATLKYTKLPLIPDVTFLNSDIKDGIKDEAITNGDVIYVGVNDSEYFETVTLTLGSYMGKIVSLNISGNSHNYYDLPLVFTEEDNQSGIKNLGNNKFEVETGEMYSFVVSGIVEDIDTWPKKNNNITAANIDDTLVVFYAETDSDLPYSYVEYIDNEEITDSIEHGYTDFTSDIVVNVPGVDFVANDSPFSLITTTQNITGEGYFTVRIDGTKSNFDKVNLTFDIDHDTLNDYVIEPVSKTGITGEGFNYVVDVEDSYVTYKFKLSNITAEKSSVKLTAKTSVDGYKSTDEADIHLNVAPYTEGDLQIEISAPPVNKVTNGMPVQCIIVNNTNKDLTGTFSVNIGREKADKNKSIKLVNADDSKSTDTGTYSEGDWYNAANIFDYTSTYEVTVPARGMTVETFEFYGVDDGTQEFLITSSFATSTDISAINITNAKTITPTTYLSN